MSTTFRKKTVLFPPLQMFATSVVSVANGGITSSSLAAGALVGQIVKSVQQVTITFASGAVTADGACTAVDLLKSIIVPAGVTIPYATATNTVQAGVVPYFLFTSTTNVRATRGNAHDSAGTALAGTASVFVVQFW